MEGSGDLIQFSKSVLSLGQEIKRVSVLGSGESEKSSVLA